MALPILKKAGFFALSQMLIIGLQAQISTEATAGPADSLAKLNQPDPKKEVTRLIIQPLNQYTGSLALKGKELLQPFTQKVALLQNSKAFQVNRMDAEASYRYFKDTSRMALGLLGDSRGTLGVLYESEIAIASLPFGFSLNRSEGIFDVDHTPFNRFYQANFDPQKYKERLRSEVLQKIKPEQVAASIYGRINAIRQQYERALLAEINQIQEELKTEVLSSLSLPVNISDLSFSDVASLKTKLFSELPVEKYQQALELQAEMKKGNLKDVADASKLQEVVATVKKYEAMEKIQARILRFKEQYEGNKAVQELKRNLPFTPSSFKEYLAKPGNLEQVIKEHGDLKSLQKIFLNISRLDLGKNPLQCGELSLQGLMNTGINTEFTNRKATLGFIQGLNNNANPWLQAGLKSFVTNEYSSLSGLTIGNGSGRVVTQNLSFLFFNFQNNPEQFTETAFLQSAYLPMAQHRDAVVTWQSGFSIDEQNEVKLDVSKSFGSFRNFLTSDSVLSIQKAFPSVLSDKGTDNFAFALDYRGELWQTPVKVYLKQVGLGYSNPGNIFLRRGAREAGIDLSRRLLKQKLSVQYRASYRQQNLDVDKMYKYLTFSNKLKAAYRIKKNNRIGLSYEQSDYRSQMPVAPVSEGNNYRLQAEGSYSVFLRGKRVMNNVNISGQKMALPVMATAAYRSSSWLVMHTSSALIHKDLLTVTFMMNQSDNKDYYYNTSFINAEVNYNYSLANGWQWTSGGGFYSNAGWNRQLGVRQQLSATVLNKCSIDLDINYKKAVHTIRPELANQLFVSTAVRYQFQ